MKPGQFSYQLGEELVVEAQSSALPTVIPKPPKLMSSIVCSQLNVRCDV